MKQGVSVLISLQAGGAGPSKKSRGTNSKFLGSVDAHLAVYHLRCQSLVKRPSKCTVYLESLPVVSIYFTPLHDSQFRVDRLEIRARVSHNGVASLCNSSLAADLVLVRCRRNITYRSHYSLPRMR